VQQVIRPTGVVDPELFAPTDGQIDDLLGEIKGVDLGAGAGDNADQAHGGRSDEYLQDQNSGALFALGLINSAN